jgi:hypothetical protein
MLDVKEFLAYKAFSPYKFFDKITLFRDSKNKNNSNGLLQETLLYSPFCIMNLQLDFYWPHV